MFDYVYLLIEEFIDYLPQFALIFLVLGIVGNLVFRKD